ncbi:MAG: AMP-binding protein, partial [Gemmataceae bacterium]|nr:AMP-binding protein [Gemmataceae bacterium]
IGEEGMLLVTGPNVMAGYLGKPEATAAVMQGGWYVTGDVARLDAEGHVTLTGRLSRFAKIAGEMVPLEKVEEALHECVGAADRVCAVTCVPDESRGERVVVLFVAAMAVKDARSWCEALAGRLPSLWTPSHRDFHGVDELPVLGSGKLDLRGVKELALSLAGTAR